MKKAVSDNTVSQALEGECTFMRTFSSQEEAELYRLKRDMERSDIEKFRLFTRMLRRNAMFKKAKISSNSSK